MKTIITYLIALILFASCDQKEHPIIHVSVLADKTDTLISHPELETIKHFFNEKENPYSKFSFKYLTIGNTDYFKGYCLEVEASSMFENTLQRKSTIQKFYKAIDTLLVTESKKQFDFQHSSILTPLIEELNRLSKDTTGKRIVLLYSDLSEASLIYNVYANQNKNSFYEIETVSKKIKGHFEIQDLTDIDLYVLYYPKTTAENKLFRNLCKIYEEIFKEFGLSIHIGIDKQLTP